LVAGVEDVELVLYAADVVATALFPVQPQGFPPHGAGLLGLVEGGVGWPSWSRGSAVK
jgi:hypothetical protein